MFRVTSRRVVIASALALGLFATARLLPTATAAQNANNKALTIATARPVVVKTVPQAGDDQVDASLTEIKVTFSKDMQDGNWAFAQMSKDSFPQTTGKPHYEADKRTCVLPVKLEPGKTYVILLNKPPYDSFMDTEKRKAMEYWLVFETKQ